MKPQRIEPGPGQESVWNYPRPPKLEPVSKRIKIIFNGQIIANTTQAIRVLETSHPPTYYLPQKDVEMKCLNQTSRSTVCEFKGHAMYWTLQVGDKQAVHTAWSYPEPTKAFLPIKDYLAFYASKMDAYYVGNEQVQTQEGDFYGGWITSEIVGPFKGGAGTWGW